MFGRGTWAVFGIRSSVLEQRFSDPALAFAASQYRAMHVTKFEHTVSIGINPFASPRKDENYDYEAPTEEGFDPATRTDCYGVGDEFKLGDGKLGFWFCINDYEDVTDPKSKQEAHAYELANKPFKFLNKDEKKQVEGAVTASAVSSRVQFPVLIDITAERVYALTTKPEYIGFLRTLLCSFGNEDEIEIVNLAWQFGDFNWPSKFLNAVRGDNKFESQMASRAEDLRRFRPDEVEKLEDKLMERIVSNYFALAELETGQWAGLSTPAKIRLFKASEPSSEASVSTAFTLLNLTQESEVVSAAVTFQHLDSKFNKKGEEKQYRTDLLTIDINDNVNLSDAGCAALRGFDLPQFKKEMKVHAKSRGSLEIRDYWCEWLIAMKNGVNIFIDNVNETLKLEPGNFGLLPYEAEEPEEE
jgi:hypothetical protein